MCVCVCKFVFSVARVRCDLGDGGGHGFLSFRIYATSM